MQTPMIVKATAPVAAFHYTLVEAEPEPQRRSLSSLLFNEVSTMPPIVHDVGECSLDPAVDDSGGQTVVGLRVRVPEPPCGPALGRTWPTSPTHPPTQQPKLWGWVRAVGNFFAGISD